MDIAVVINQMIVLFVMLALGYTAGKTKILTRDGGMVLSRVIVTFAQPCLILYSVIGGSIVISGSDVVFYMLVVLVVYAVALAVSIPASRLLYMGKNAPKADRNIYCYMCIFANVAFMGFPVCYAIFGPESAFYVALFSVVFNLLNFSLGVYLISGKRDRFSIKPFINPPLIAALISIPIAILGLSVPRVFVDITRLAGNMTVPGIMLVVGSTLAHVSLKNLLMEWRLYPLALLRLIVIPVLTWLVLRQFVTDDLIFGVLVVVSATPVAMAATVLAFRYGGNERLVSTGTLITTVLSVITIPLIVFLLLM